MITVPQAFYKDTSIRVRLREGLNCVVWKTAEVVNENTRRYLSAHALTIVQSGALSVTTDTGEMLVVQQGQMVFLPKNLYLMSDIIPQGGSFTAVVYFFEEKLVNDFINSRNTDSNNTSDHKLWKEEQTVEVELFTQNLIDLYGNKTSAPVGVSAVKLTELLHLLTMSGAGESFLQVLLSTKNRNKLSIKQFMKLNFDKPLKVEDYAYLSGRSLSSFHRDFKRVYGTGPKQWLIEQRLDKAQEQIEENTSLSITQVAYSVGYENISHFIRAFQKRFGLSPKQYQMNRRKSILV